MPRAVEDVGHSGIVKTAVTEDPGCAGGPQPNQLAETMKGVREAEERSAAPRVIMGDSIQFTANLDGINREWNKLDTAGRDKFLSEKLLSMVSLARAISSIAIVSWTGLKVTMPAVGSSVGRSDRCA